ncbi:MAG: ATP-binding protein [Clostridia bacterium]|nr:ATP-binding protein [Clostridia bacterium]
MYNFLNQNMRNTGINYKLTSKILLASEEIFVNIASYAYPKSLGNVNIKYDYNPNDFKVGIQFIDEGTPFDPTSFLNFNTSKDISERRIGGLGIFMVKKTMDTMEYFYESGKNNLIISKIINSEVLSYGNK